MRLFKTSVTAKNFQEIAIKSPKRPALCWYSYDLAVDPLDENHLFMTAVNVWESMDGGATWAIVDAPGVHADAHQFILKSYSQGATKNLLYVTTDGGAYQGYRYKDLDEYKWDWIPMSKGVASTEAASPVRIGQALGRGGQGSRVEQKLREFVREVYNETVGISMASQRNSGQPNRYGVR